jgi:hypothetical protein
MGCAIEGFMRIQLVANNPEEACPAPRTPAPPVRQACLSGRPSWGLPRPRRPPLVAALVRRFLSLKVMHGVSGGDDLNTGTLYP